MKACAFASLFVALLLSACTLPVRPTETPTPSVSPSATPIILPPGATPSAPPPVPTPTAPFSTAALYAVVDVLPSDVLNVRAGPGTGYEVIDRFAYNATGIRLTGPAAQANGASWVQVERPAGGAGWVNAAYLTEYVPPERFCTDERVPVLLADFRRAVLERNGVLLGGLVSPRRGLAVMLYRLNRPIVFHADDARWVFVSTYVHNWGPHPARGDAEVGSFQEKVLPRLEEVFRASYEQLCEQRDAIYQPAWPEAWTNLRVVKLLKPASDPNVTLDFRIWLVGIEYVDGQPYLAGLVHIEWEP